MLKTLKLHNFKTFLNAQFSFKQRHLVLGRNNAGKTNLASALNFLAATRHLEFGQAVSLVPGGMSELCNWHLKSNQIDISCTCELDIDEDFGEFTYELILARDIPQRFSRPGESEMRVVRERLTLNAAGFDGAILLDNNGRDVTLLDEEQHLQSKGPAAFQTLAASPRNATMLSRLYELETNRRAILFRNYLGSWRYYALNPDEMRRGFDASASIVFPFGPGGHELADAIFRMKNGDEKRYRRLIEHAQTVEPALDAINFHTMPDRPPFPALSLAGRANCSWTGLSDGTLRVLALACIVEFAAQFGTPEWPPNYLGIIEEPENGIFPGQLRKIFDLFEQWAPAAQFIFTSHSPYFIDMFDNRRDAVTILRKAVDRSESLTPAKAKIIENGEAFTLSQEYSAELLG